MKNDFSSIDRLMEFGLSMAVAQQMISTMNYCIANAAVPGAGNPIAGQGKRFFAVVDGSQVGPLDDRDVEVLISAGRITAQSLMWRQGMSGWGAAETIPEVNRMLMLKK